MYRCYKYRIYPNANQSRELEIMLGTHCRLYNECLEWRKFSWDVYRVGITFQEQRNWFRHQQFAGHPFYSRLNNHSANLTLKRLDLAFRNFFHRVRAGEKVGYPRFKNPEGFASFTFDNLSGAKLTGTKLRIQHVGAVRVKLHRPLAGKVKTATIKREAGNWYLVVSAELPEVPKPSGGRPPVGIDVGIEAFLTTSDGDREPNPAYLEMSIPELRRRDRSLSRKNKGGRNRHKARKRLAILHARIRNRRRDHHHKTALNLVRRYGLIAMERLNIRGMLGSHRLARAILDAGWYGFGVILSYKAESAGGQVVQVDPRGTSQDCSWCGDTVRKDLSVRIHRCPRCGLTLHRDVNAARNILARGLARAGPAGLNVGQQAVRAPRSPPQGK